MEGLLLEYNTFNLFGIWFTINGMLLRYLNSLGLSYHSIIVLWTIFDSSTGISQSEICVRSHISKQAVNKIVKCFAEKNYIVFINDGCNKKSKKVILTKLGDEYVKSIVVPILIIEEKAINDLIFKKISQILDKIDLEISS